MRAVADRDRRQPFITANPVIAVNNEIAGAEHRQFGQKSIRAFLALVAADKAVAEKILFGDNGDGGRGKTMVERDDNKRDGALGGDRLRILPSVGHRHAVEPMIGEQARDAFTRTCRIACEDQARLAELFRVIGERVVNIFGPAAFGAKVARPFDGEVQDFG